MNIENSGRYQIVALQLFIIKLFPFAQAVKMRDDINVGGDLDTIFVEIGEFGIYQIAIYLLICIVIVLAASHQMNYVFAANTLDYRCKIPECDENMDNRQIKFKQPWLSYAIPTINNDFSNCFRYARIPENVTEIVQNACVAEEFDSNKQIECNEFVHSTDEINLQTDLNIHCSESYKLALVGTVSGFGRFIFLPFTGFLSDKFGRLRVVIIAMLLSSIFGLIKSFSISYFMYIIFEFLKASSATCVYAGLYILSIEWVSSKYRAIGSTMIAISFSIGEILLGVAAMYIHNYRYLLRVLYTPGLFIVIFHWLLPESSRWLLVRGEVERVVAILERTASVNGKKLSEKSIEMLRSRYSPNYLSKDSSVDEENTIDAPSISQSLLSILKSQKLCLRFVNSSYIWITCCYCYYGLSLISTNIPGADRYTSFIIIAAVEIPTQLVTSFLLNRMTRRRLLFGTFMFTALCTIAIPFIPEAYSTISLILSMLGKAPITCAFTTIYTFTAEMWPTCTRTTILSSCSMIARIGAMIAPLTPLLATYSAALPFFLFGSTAVLASLSVLFMCETFNKKLPDTIDEAKNL